MLNEGLLRLLEFLRCLESRGAGLRPNVGTAGLIWKGRSRCRQKMSETGAM